MSKKSETQDQGSLDAPSQEWTPEEPFDRIADVPAGKTSGGPVNPVLSEIDDSPENHKADPYEQPKADK